jgi:outer membrane immunogenic protein
MRKLLTGIAAGASVLFVASGALADGQNYGPSNYGPRCASFQGFYLGGNGGFAYHDHTWNDRDAWARNEVDLALPASVEGTDNGWTAGVQGGYNWQSGCTLFGFETDWNWADLDSSIFSTDGQPGAALDKLTVKSELSWFGTVRGRAGVVVDNVLLYTTGGLAYARTKGSWTTENILAGGPLVETFSTSETRWGWVAGGGTEWAVGSNITIKSEALYMQFEDQDSTFNSRQATLNGNPPTKRFDEQDSAAVARVGVNYRFGCGAGC